MFKLCIKLYGFPDLDPKDKKASDAKLVKKTTLKKPVANTSMNRSGYSTQENTLNSFDSKNNSQMLEEQDSIYRDAQRRST